MVNSGQDEPVRKKRLAPVLLVAWAAMLIPLGIIMLRYPEWKRAAKVREEQKQRAMRDSYARPGIHYALTMAGVAGDTSAFAVAVSQLPHGAEDVDAFMALRDSIRAGHIEILQYWIDHGWPLTFKEDSILTGCMGAASVSENPKIVRLMLDKGAGMDYGGDCLLNATLQDSDAEAEIALMLIKAGADVNKAFTDHEPLGPLYVPPYLVWPPAGDRDRFGYTPLMLAARNGHKEVVHALLAKGANPRLRNSVGQTALDIAEERSYKEIVVLLKDAAKR